MVKKRKKTPVKKNTAGIEGSKGSLAVYNSDDGSVKLDVRLENETVWLTQQMMAGLFGTSIPNINMHIKNIIKEGELSENSVIKDFLIPASDGKNYNTKFYNLDMIISVGYRINLSKVPKPCTTIYQPLCHMPFASTSALRATADRSLRHTARSGILQERYITSLI